MNRMLQAEASKDSLQREFQWPAPGTSLQSGRWSSKRIQLDESVLLRKSTSELTPGEVLEDGASKGSLHRYHLPNVCYCTALQSGHCSPSKVMDDEVSVYGFSSEELPMSQPMVVVPLPHLRTPLAAPKSSGSLDLFLQLSP